MSWFSAKLRLEANCERGRDEFPLSEDSIRVVRAGSEDEALRKAEVLGRGSEHSYRNDEGELISWRFVEVVEVQDLCVDELADGTEVYSRFVPRPTGGGADRPEPG